MDNELNDELKIGNLVKFPSGVDTWPKYFHGRIVAINPPLPGSKVRRLIIRYRGQTFERLESEVTKLYEDITPFYI